MSRSKQPLRAYPAAGSSSQPQPLTEERGVYLMTSATAAASREARLQAAREYVATGLSLIPIDAKSKWPPEGFGWKVYQERRPTDDELRDWAGRYPGLGVVGGKVSGHRNGDGEGKDALEILDLESIAPLHA